MGLLARADEIHQLNAAAGVERVDSAVEDLGYDPGPDETVADAPPWLRQPQEARKIAAAEPIERFELARDGALVVAAI